jgi:hypothetical protein
LLQPILTSVSPTIRSANVERTAFPSNSGTPVSMNAATSPSA